MDTQLGFLDIVDEDIGPLPDYILNLMKFLGYDNYLSLNDFNATDILEIEQFAQTKLRPLLDNTQTELRKYYGPYHASVIKFHIMPGHKKILLNLGKYIRDKGRSYFIKRQIEMVNQQAFLTTTAQPQYDTDDINHDDDHDKINDSTEYDAAQHTNDSLDCNIYETPESPQSFKRIKLERPLQFPTDVNKEENAQRIRSLVDRWLLSVMPKLNSGIKIEDPEDYAVAIFYKPEEGKLTATIQCCICKNIIGVSSQLKKSGAFRWLISNYMRHVKKLHYDKAALELSMTSTTVQGNMGNTFWCNV